MKRIYIADVIHEQLKREARTEGRTLQWVVENKLTGTTPLPKNIRPVDIPVSDLLRAEETGMPENKIGATPFVDDLHENDDMSDGEKLCCKNTFRPCAHWVWDSETGEGHRNSLSGRFRELE